MPSSYTPSLRLVLPVTGELLGAWGDTVNNGLTLLAEDAIAGSADIAMPDANVTLTTNNELPDQARRMFINLTGTLTATRDVICPAVSKLYFVHNAATQAVVFKTSAGTGVTVPVDSRIVLYCDGTNVVPAVNDLPAAAKAGGVALVTVSGTQTLTNKTLTDPVISGGTINNASVGAITPSTGAFTSLTASLDSSFTSAGALTIPVGTTAERPAAAVGKIRWNTTLDQYEGYDGTNWTLLGGAVISNDTATATNVFPVFAGVTSGNVSTLFTGNAKLLYKPSTGELQSTALVASNGLVVNSATVSENYTIPTGSNASSAGPITVDSGAVVTIPTGSRWVVL